MKDIEIVKAVFTEYFNKNDDIVTEIKQIDSNTISARIRGFSTLVEINPKKYSKNPHFQRRLLVNINGNQITFTDPSTNRSAKLKFREKDGKMHFTRILKRV